MGLDEISVILSHVYHKLFCVQQTALPVVLMKFQGSLVMFIINCFVSNRLHCQWVLMKFQGSLVMLDCIAGWS